MEDITSPFQGAFVKNRQILDEILIANECVEEMRTKGRKGIVCKVDLEKDYDHVNWNFLDYVLDKKKNWWEIEKLDSRLCLYGTLFHPPKQYLKRFFLS